MVTTFSINTACRVGALLRAEFMGHPTWHYPDSMANLYYGNNFYNDISSERGCFEGQLPTIHEAIKGMITTGTISRAIASDM